MSEYGAQEIGELLDTVSEKVPKMLRELLGSLYSPETGANMGKAVGSFYKGLVEAGIPADEAIKMARDYIISVKDTMSNMNKQDTMSNINKQ